MNLGHTDPLDDVRSYRWCKSRHPTAPLHLYRTYRSLAERIHGHSREPSLRGKRWNIEWENSRRWIRNGYWNPTDQTSFVRVEWRGKSKRQRPSSSSPFPNLSEWTRFNSADEFIPQVNLRCVSKKVELISVNARFILARMPFGGSLVTLTLFCKTLTGKVLAGIELRKRRKLAWHGVMPSLIFLTIDSMLTIQLAAKWQFCRKIHSPATTDLVIRSSATGPWPWPREIAL